MNPVSAISAYKNMLPAVQQIQPNVNPGKIISPDNTQVIEPGQFENVVKQFIDKVDTKQKVSERAITDYVSGKTNDLLPIVNEMAKADLSFKLLTGVRNKVIEAYKETMRMQI